MSQQISVIGATGKQGGGVVEILLETSDYNVRAISSKGPASDKGKSLLERYSKYVDEGRFEVVQGDLNDRNSLENAIKGSYGLYASFSPSPSEGPIEENPEVIQGKNLVDAAKAMGVEHFVYSSLPSVTELTGGKLSVFPFEAKALVENYARQELKNSTFVIPGSFFSNLQMPVWAKRRDDGVFVMTVPLPAETKVGWVDESYDMGTFVTAIFKKGPSVTAGKTYPINSTPVTSQELAKAYTQVTGEPADVDPLSLESYAGILNSFAGPVLSEALVNMIKFLAQNQPSPYTYGPGYIEKDTSFEDLGVKASSPEEFFKRTGWKAPPVNSSASH
ncbi:hypothetical protein JCM5350_007771 [Sporobolomyces pararoseus]